MQTFTQALTQQQWLESTLGQHLCAQEQAMYDETVADIFGFNALQIGLLSLNTLKSSRIAHVMRVGNCEGDALCESDYLPFAESCIDLVCLPHVLEFSRNPHQTLREAERVLVPEGYLIITGFNPISTWGLKSLLSKNQNYPWAGQFFSLSRIKDWLALLGLELIDANMRCFELPINEQKWLKRTRFMGQMGEKWWPMFGGMYFIVAKKRVVNMTLLKPKWKNNALKSRLVTSNNPKSHSSLKPASEPTIKTKPTKNQT